MSDKDTNNILQLQLSAVICILGLIFALDKQKNYMAKPKNCVSGIPAIYRADTIEHIMFGYVRGCQACEPGRSVSNIIESFLHDFELIETFDKESALVVLQRINQRFRENSATI